MGKRKPIWGWGINDADYVVQPMVEGKRDSCPFYMTWKNMVTRVHDPAYRATRATYVGCSICEEWRYFMTFRAWMIEQNWQGKHLDKDILIPGNKVYSPDTCVFVPREINTLLCAADSIRGQYPRGVEFNKQRGGFRAQMYKHGKPTHLGIFTTPEAAHAAYIKAKVIHVFEIAMQQTDQRIKDGLTFHCFKLQGVM